MVRLWGVKNVATLMLRTLAQPVAGLVPESAPLQSLLLLFVMLAPLLLLVGACCPRCRGMRLFGSLSTANAMGLLGRIRRPPGRTRRRTRREESATKTD